MVPTILLALLFLLHERSKGELSLNTNTCHKATLFPASQMHISKCGGNTWVRICLQLIQTRPPINLSLIRIWYQLESEDITVPKVTPLASSSPHSSWRHTEGDSLALFRLLMQHTLTGPKSLSQTKPSITSIQFNHHLFKTCNLALLCFRDSACLHGQQPVPSS